MRPRSRLNANLLPALISLSAEKWVHSAAGRRGIETRKLRSEDGRAIYIKLKRIHKRNCFATRRKAWRKFVTDTGNPESWGSIFKWLHKGGTRQSETLLASIQKADGTYTRSLKETEERLLDALVS